MPRTRRQRQTTPPVPILEPRANTATNGTQTDVEDRDGTNTITHRKTDHRMSHPIDVDSTDSEDYTPKKSTKSKPKIQVFKGIGDKVTIDNWLKRYDMIANHYNWKESEKSVMLGNFLEDDALNWYIENYANDSYSEIKSKLINMM